MPRNEQPPQPNEPSEQTGSVQPPQDSGAEPVVPARNESVPAPRQFSEDEKHKREEIIHGVQLIFRSGKSGLTVAERRAKRAMQRGQGPKGAGGKPGLHKPPDESVES